MVPDGMHGGAVHEAVDEVHPPMQRLESTGTPLLEFEIAEPALLMHCAVVD